ncbi:uncharacterized protein LOC129786952 [Lutzomyia longipalpis]|uniref:uncharacterized protein LOC129786952 n=1 Tax=Lutzomyia longipalpis TaxID=7200 RepID=UPI0024837AD9|nr:uncharacterized protein LOC129786952 [Lutzomyia longipalpis]XP_055678194.1 uncharacterized protein LOC129786952 [Lutzomyia longipalpis]
MDMRYIVAFVAVSFLISPVSCVDVYKGIERLKCANREGVNVRPHSEFRHHLRELRTKMRIQASVPGSELDAYIVPTFDEHQSEYVAESDQRRRFLSGFSGSNGDVAVTLNSAALWTDERFLSQADSELDCEWKIFRMNSEPSIGKWLTTQLGADAKVGADSQIVPHYMWQDLKYELSRKSIRLIDVNRYILDSIWGDQRPQPFNDPIRTHPVVFAGEKWENKIAKLRANLTSIRADAMVITSLTEVAYILNLRGNDIPYIPVFKAYLIVTQKDIFLYTNQSRIDFGVSLHLKSEPCHHENCVQVRDYNAIWSDLRTFSQQWQRVLIPTYCVFDMGASEAIYSALPQKIIVERVSPIIYMRAQKNKIEREGMENAHIRDAAALCDIFSYLEERFGYGDNWTELELSKEIDRTRRSQKYSHDISFETVVAYGEHGALPYYTPSNTSNAIIYDNSTLLIDSGGQYYDGTTDVARTLHMGTPTIEQKRAYTLVLSAMIRLSTLVFPENLRLSDVDILPRGILWGDFKDYPHGSGHGVGSFSSVHESPITIAHTTKHRYTFKEGYFFSNEPGLYKSYDFGIKLKNILEVVDTGKLHPTGKKFYAFRDVTLVPFEPKLIDRTMLSSQEKRWLNEYNARIRNLVGAELKRQTKMQAFYWMMNKTKHIIEYLPEKEYRSAQEGNNAISMGKASRTLTVFILFGLVRALL